MRAPPGTRHGNRLVPAFSWRYAGPVLLIALGVLLLTRRTETS